MALGASKASDNPVEQPPTNRPIRPKSTSNPKSFSKCDTCRTRKVKCTPVDRAWNQMCDPCRKSGLDECPPNTTIVRKKSVRKSTATTTRPEPGCTESTPTSGVIAADPTLKSKAVVIQSRKSSGSSPTTPSLPCLPSNSFHEHSDSKISDVAGSTYDKCCPRLRDVGPFIDLYRFVQHRYNTLDRMSSALPRLNNSDIEAALGYFLRIIGSRIVRYLRQLEQYRKRGGLDEAQWELVTRRMVIAWQRFLGLHGEKSEFLPTPENSWEMFASLKKELSGYYQNRGDFTEADRLRYQCIESGEYLGRCPMATLEDVARRISTAMKEALPELDPKYKNRLDLKNPIEITASHLALMFLPHTSVQPAECPPTGGTGLTGRNTYHLAAEVGNPDYFEYHLRNSPQETQEFLSARDIFGMTPLMVAAYSGNLKVFETLVKYGANLSEQIPAGRSVLSLASMAGNLEIVQFILGHGVSVRQYIEWCSPIHDAAAAGRHEVVDFLIADGSNPQEKHHGFTPAQLASHNGHDELARSLGYSPNPTQSLIEANAKSRKRQKICSTSNCEDVMLDSDPVSEGGTEMRNYQIESSHDGLPPLNMSADSLPPDALEEFSATPRSFPNLNENNFEDEIYFDPQDFDSMQSFRPPFGYGSSTMHNPPRGFN